MIRFRGVAQVVIFNWPKILAGLFAIMVGVVGRRRLPTPVRLMARGAGWWTPVSLLASWWIYDLSPLRRWRFVTAGLPSTPSRVLLVVAGFDEISPVVEELWPDAALDVVDVVVRPEASVRRARRWYPADVPIVAPSQLGSGRPPYDLVLFAQSAHEIRDDHQRRALFAAARAALSDDGRIVLVEHLRDLANVVAFGPGAWHFTSERVWRTAFDEAGLTITHHQTITALVHCWTLTPAPS